MSKDQREIIAYQERILLGAWLLGFHIKDKELFKASDFRDYELFKICGNYDLWGVAKRLNRRPEELTSLCDEYSEPYYESALNYFFLEKLKQHIIADCESITTLDDVADNIKNHISKSCNKTANNLYDSFSKELEERRTGRTAKYGLPTLDKVSGGIFKNELIVLSAKTSVGKSAFAIQIAENVSRNNKVLFFPLEMSTNEMIARMLIRNGIIDNEQYKTGCLGNKEEQIKAYIKRIEESGNLLFYEGVNKLEEIKAIVNREKPYLVVIDQLSQIVVDRRFNSIHEQYGYITCSLKAMSKHENVATLLLCQVSVKNNQSDLLASIKDSSQISEDADFVIMLEKLDKRPPIPIPDNDSAMRLTFPKQRMGTQGFYYLGFSRKKQKFYETITTQLYEK